MSRHGDDRDVVPEDPGLRVPNDPGRLEPVHLRHLHVHQDKIVRDRFQGRDRLLAVGHRVGPIAEFLQDAQGHLLVDHVVLGHQDADPPLLVLLQGVSGDDRPGALLGSDGRHPQDRDEAVIELGHLDRLGQVGGKADLLQACGRPHAVPQR